MVDGVVEQLPSLGIAGLLFVMWWQERVERLRTLKRADATDCCLRDANEAGGQLLTVVRGNTDALVTLREELRATSAAEREWFERLLRQMERLELA